MEKTWTRLGPLERSILMAGAATGRVPTGTVVKSNQHRAAERLFRKGLVGFVGGCWFLTDDGLRVARST